MTDLVDYLTNECAFLEDHPDWGEFENDLLIGALDFADYELRQFRKKDRLADVMADARWIPWIAIPADRQGLLVGERVLVRHSGGDSLGLVAEVSESDRYFDRFNVQFYSDRPGFVHSVPSVAPSTGTGTHRNTVATLGLHPSTPALT